MYFPDANNIIASWQGKHTLHAVKEAEGTVFCLECKGVETILYRPIREVRGWVSPDNILWEKRQKFYPMLRPLFSSDKSSVVFGLFVKKINEEVKGKAVGFLENEKFCVEIFPKEGPSFPIKQIEGFGVPSYRDVVFLDSGWLWIKKRIDECSEVTMRDGFLQFQSITSHIVIRGVVLRNIIIEADMGDLVMSIKEKFNTLIDEIPFSKQQIFFFNERKLENERTLAYYGIRSGSPVDVILRKGGMRLTSFNTMQEEKMIEPTDSEGLLWSIHPGLNLQGKCSNRGCKAYCQTIWIQKGFGCFNISKECQISECPQCREIAIDVNNCVITSCIYSIEGETLRGERMARYHTRAPAKKFLTYKSSIENWRKLLITTEQNFSDPFRAAPLRPSFEEIPPLDLESSPQLPRSRFFDEPVVSSEGICTLL